MTVLLLLAPSLATCQIPASIIMDEATMQVTGDSLARAFPARYPRPVSQWQAEEKARYQKLLATGKFDALVVPAQVSQFAFSRSVNSLITAQIYRAIVKAQHLRIPDPYLVARALGEGSRTLNRTEIYHLAETLGVKTIFWIHVGHDNESRMTLLIQKQESPNDQPPSATTKPIFKKLENVQFSSARSPADEVQAALPGMLAALGIQYEATLAANALPDPDFPASPVLMVSAPSDPIKSASYFQILAAFTPLMSQRARERFLEKSLVALLDASPNARDYKLLKARALMQLGMRPAALATLGTPTGAEGKALQAILNGNMPDALAAIRQIKQPVRKFLADMDALSINLAYGAYQSSDAEKKVAAMRLPGATWRFLAMRTYRDLDDWIQFDNLELKALLDVDFPLQGFTAKEIARGLAVVGNPAQAGTAVDFSVRDHVLGLITKDPSNWCCGMAIDRPAPLDYLDLIEEIATDNLSRRVNFSAQIQGQPERALEQLATLDPVYKDHPKFTLLRARAEAATAYRKEGVAREGLLKSAYLNALNAYYWEQGQTYDSADAFTFISNSNRGDFGYLDNIYFTDYPTQPYFSTWWKGDVDLQVARTQTALDNSTTDIHPIQTLAWIYRDIRHDENELARLFVSINHRFDGNATIAMLKANETWRKGDIKAAESGYRDAIRMQPKLWEPYGNLAELLFRDARAADAAKVTMSYPGFSVNSKENKVGIANSAAQVGALFYWSGNFAEAIPLYEIASGLQTGSDSSIESGARLKLLQDDYMGALRGVYDRATRYNSSYGYRDYLGLLHIMGYSKDAWDAFNYLANQSGRPHIWETALVGHRHDGLTESALIAWARQDSNRSLGYMGNDAARYLLRAVVIDRSPSDAAISAIAELDTPVWSVPTTRDLTVRVSKDGQMEYVLGPESSENSTLPINVFARAKKVRIKSDLVYFAEAYKALHEKNYEASRSLFEEAAGKYNFSQISLGYMLPYAAFAAAKSGKTELIEKKLAAYKPGRLDFDKILSEAVLTGIAGKSEESLRLLRLALYRRPYTEGRPVFTEYEYAEIAEWLFEATGNTGYRDIALDWAKKCQKTQPWHAWAYAMEAKLSNDAGGRQVAIGIANYLDPNSERLKSIPKAEIEAAVNSFRNPFLVKPGAKDKTTLTSPYPKVATALH